MRDAVVTTAGDRIRWVELPGAEPVRVYLHGLGASSPVYLGAAAAHPALAGHRSLLVDMLGFGISDRPEDFTYTLEAHADALAEALVKAGVSGADLVAHSMGGSVAIVLAERHPELVARLVLAAPNLDPITPSRELIGSGGISSWTEEEFLAGGWQQVRDAVGVDWWATMRLAGLTALHRSAVHLARATTPTMRVLLERLTVPRTLVLPSEEADLPGIEELRRAGVTVTVVEDSGHNVMFDQPDVFVATVAAALAC